MTTTSKKPSLPYFISHWLLIVILMIFIIFEFAHLFRVPSGLKSSPQLFEKHFSFTKTFPFFGNYYLMTPQDYDPKKKYPLVISLHGSEYQSYPAAHLSKKNLRNKYPMFVIVPVAPQRAVWISPKNNAYAYKNQVINYPDHMPFVLKAIEQVTKKHSIDKEKIYISGHGYGGAAVIGALQNYPKIFASGIATAAKWDPEEISNIENNVHLYHGLNDLKTDVQNSTNLSTIAKRKKIPIEFTILRTHNHDIGDFIFGNENSWELMINP